MSDTDTEPKQAKIAPHWLVVFETDEGSCHPVWYGAPAGEPIASGNVRAAARQYLNSNKDWLVRIESIEPFEAEPLENP